MEEYLVDVGFAYLPFLYLMLNWIELSFLTLDLIPIIHKLTGTKTLLTSLICHTFQQSVIWLALIELIIVKGTRFHL